MILTLLNMLVKAKNLINSSLICIFFNIPKLNTCLFHIKGIDNVDSKEFICEYFCNSKEFTNRLHRIFSFLEKYPNDFYQIIENEVIL